MTTASYDHGMLPAAVMLVYALAVARVTRLVTSDRITEAPRERLAAALWRRYKPIVPPADRDVAEPPLAVYLLRCPWCVSIYVAAVAAPIAYLWGSNPIFLIPALALAFSHVTGLLAQKEG